MMNFAEINENIPECNKAAESKAKSNRDKLANCGNCGNKRKY
jgi:anaerobic ribonucleoside-triphosphate reductase